MNIVFNYTQNSSAILIFEILAIIGIASNMIPKINIKYGYFRLVTFISNTIEIELSVLLIYPVFIFLFLFRHLLFMV